MGLNGRSAHTPSGKGFPGLLKWGVAAAALIALAAYVGRDRQPASVAYEPVAAAMPAPAQVVSRPVVISGRKDDGASSPARVDDARIAVSGDGRTLHVEGSIGRRFASDLEQALHANRFIQRIVISSGGGYAGPGLQAARLIRLRNLTVRVHGVCASMCVGLWAAASARELEPDAVIGLHQWRATCGSLPEAERKECEYTVQFQTAHDKSYDGWLRAAGFNRRLLDLQESTAADDIAVLTAPVLWDNGVDFRVVDARGQPMSREQTLRYLADRQARDNGS